MKKMVYGYLHGQLQMYTSFETVQRVSRLNVPVTKTSL